MTEEEEMNYTYIKNVKYQKNKTARNILVRILYLTNVLELKNNYRWFFD